VISCFVVKWWECFVESRHFFLGGEKKEPTSLRQGRSANLLLPWRIYSDEVRLQPVRSRNVESSKFCL
jgi:hypothetical protein